ncbi:MAG TPA: hypothetical protein VK428_11265 [Acidimicrobiales bacterium]|nr:hypothetical protein [Acidimicrobiales bacterium]
MTRLSRDRRHSPTEAGVTLVEMLVVCSTMAVVMAVSVPSVQALYHDSTALSRTYTVVDQVVPATESLARYLREAVEPGPSQAAFLNATIGGVPYSTNASAITFFTDTGNANGPERAVAVLNTTTSIFTLTMTPADSGSCPPAGSGCTYTRGPTHTLVSVGNVINSAATPIFTYTLPRSDPATVTSGSDTVDDTSIQAVDKGLPVTGTGIPAGTYVGTVTPGTSFLLSSSPTSQVNVDASDNGTFVSIVMTTTSTPTVAQLGDIVAVSVDIEAQLLPGNASGFQTMVYLLAPTYQTWVG